MFRLQSLARFAAAFFIISATATHAYADTFVPAVPEVDAGSAASALTLLFGSGMLLRDQVLARLRRK